MDDQPAPHTRYHAFDALRASMMMLGLVVHASQYYMTAPAMGEGFHFQDSRPTPAADWLLFGIHTFRMQVFFVMSGFFTSLLYARRGRAGMVRNRVRRVVLPLVVGWLILFPPSVSAFLYGCAQRAGYPPWQGVMTWWRTGRIEWVEDWSRWGNLLVIDPFHLWFLYVLAWYLLGTLVALRFARVGNGAVGRGLDRAFRWLVSTGVMLPVAMVGSFVLLIAHPVAMFSQEFPSFFPNPLALAGFASFFVFGWYLHRHADLLPRIEARTYVALATVGLLILLYLYYLPLNFGDAGYGRYHLLFGGLGAAIAWLSVYGFIGLFLRHFDRPSPALRYLADSAYWVYLIHLPFVYWLQVMMYDVPWPGLVKFAVVLLATIVFVFATYEFLVRSTYLGQWLNGRRYPPGRHRLAGSTMREPSAPTIASELRAQGGEG